MFPDPTVVRTLDGIYYAYGSHQNRDVDENERLVPILRSRDLIDWEYVGEAFDQKPNWKAEGNLWAPNVVRLDGRYRLYYSYATWGDENPGIGVASSTSPEGPFVDHGKLFRSGEIGVHNSIDPSFLFDDGTPYLFWGSHRGLYGIELTPGGRSTSPAASRPAKATLTAVSPERPHWRTSTPSGRTSGGVRRDAISTRTPRMARSRATPCPTGRRVHRRTSSSGVPSSARLSSNTWTSALTRPSTKDGYDALAPVRDRALAYLIGYSGVRGAEALSKSDDDRDGRNGATRDDLDLEAGTIDVLGKSQDDQ